MFVISLRFKDRSNLDETLYMGRTCPGLGSRVLFISGLRSFWIIFNITRSRSLPKASYNLETVCLLRVHAKTSEAVLVNFSIDVDKMMPDSIL